MATFKSLTDGLDVLRKYLKEGDEGEVEAQHDIIFASPGITYDETSPEDRAKLEELGWHFDSEGDCWAKFT